MAVKELGLDKILVVDDEESVRWVLTKGLEKKGCQVKAVESGEDALEEMEKIKYPLVFLDIGLPGMSGFDVLEKIKGMDRDSFVVIITAQATMKNAIEAIKRGAHDYLVKPFDLEQIYIIIDKILEIKNLTNSVASTSDKRVRTLLENKLSGILDEKEKLKNIKDRTQIQLKCRQ